jgi:hypothetical protein
VLLPRDMYIYLTDRQTEGGRGASKAELQLDRRPPQRTQQMCLCGAYLTSVPSRLGFVCGCSMIMFSILWAGWWEMSSPVVWKIKNS